MQHQFIAGFSSLLATTFSK